MFIKKEVKMYNFFYAYPDSSSINHLLILFNSFNLLLNISLIVFLFSLSLGIFGYSKKSIFNINLFFIKFNINNFLIKKLFYLFIILISIGIIYIFYLTNFWPTMYIIVFCYLLISIILFLNIERKSLKYFSLIFSIFISILLMIYIEGLHILTMMMTISFHHFHIQKYQIFYKNYFEIYQPNKNLFSMDFWIDHHRFFITNNHVYKRVYIFYYFMNSLGILFWIFVYSKILKFHGIKLIKN
jgi:hypothetical protein